MAPTKKIRPIRQTWDKQAMANAILAVRNSEMGFLKAAKTYNVPKTTLIRLSKKENLPMETITNIKLGRKAVLPPVLEIELVNYILEMEKSGFGLTRRDIKTLAYQLAARNNLRHTFSEVKKSAGKTWLRLFLARHPTLTFRRPTGTSVARMKGFNKEDVHAFYDLLQQALEEFNYAASNIYNVNETGISVVPSKMPEVLSLKGKKQIAAVTSAKRGSTVTCVLCMNAAGSFVPPMMIYPRKRDHPQLIHGAPPGTIHACHPSGWIQIELFTSWFKHFLKHVKPSASSPVLLILDGHLSHTRNIEVIDLARENHVKLLSIPPHSSHKIQPLDKTFMGPLKKYLTEEIRIQMRIKTQAITHYDIATLFGRAYIRAQCAELAINGFRATGIYPLNRNVFKDYDFIEDTPNITEDLAKDNPVNNNIVNENVQHEEEQIENLVPNPLPGPSTAPAFLSPKMISPVPRLKKTSTNRGRKATKATVLTSSPYKKDLEESLAKSLEKQRVQAAKIKRNFKSDLKEDEQKLENNKKTSRKPRLKKTILKEDESSSEDSDDFSVKDSSDESPDRSQKDTAACLYCNGCFYEDTHGEKWIQCISCGRWGHVECAGTDDDKYLCEVCT